MIIADKIISSRQNSGVRLLKALLSDGCRKHGLFVIEGEKIFSEYLRLGYTPEAVYMTEKMYDVSDYAGKITVITAELAAYISDTKTPQGVFALCKLTDALYTLPQNPSRLLILDGVSDPGNLGTLIRSAEAFGWQGVITSPGMSGGLAGCADSMSGKAFRASAGSRLRMPVVSAALLPYIAKLRGDGFAVYAAVLDAHAVPLENIKANVKKSEKIAVIIGSEAHGVSAPVRSCASGGVYIPIRGSESLNAAVAGGIILYELRV